MNDDDMTIDEKLEALNALEVGGVDNWDGYETAVQIAEDEGYDLDNEPHLFYDALMAAGVDEWEWFSESLEGVGD